MFSSSTAILQSVRQLQEVLLGVWNRVINPSMRATSKANQVEKVFEKTRFYLKLLNLYNKHGIFVKSIKIPRLLISAMVLFPMNLGGILISWRCIDEGFSLNTKSINMSFIFIIIQMTLTYLTIARKNDRIVEVLGDLEGFIRKSMMKHKDWSFWN